MWVDGEPIQRDWQGGRIIVLDTLYEFDGPIVFLAQVGLNKLLFAKRDEGLDFDFYVAVETSDAIISALREGRISLFGSLNRSECWLIETDLNSVGGFQYLKEGQFESLLPQPKIGLYNQFGVVPDTLEQAESFISFRFLGPAVRNGRVPLSVLQDKINDFALFVRKTLVPQALANGRDYRFFDLEMAEPKFSSLVLAAKKPTFDENKISGSARLNRVNAEILNEQANRQAGEFWELLRQTIQQIDDNGEVNMDFIVGNQDFISNLQGLIPSDGEGISRIEITYNDGEVLRTALIGDEKRRKIVEAQAVVDALDVRTLTGVIIEVNGDAGTFIIKNLAERQTTCDMPWVQFEQMDDDEQLYRGRQVSVTGVFTRRVRRDYLWIEHPVVFLN